MAFETLRPHQSQILGLVDQGRTLAQIADILAAQHGANTTPGTLSRFITSVRTPPKARPLSPPPPPATPLPPLTPEQHAQVDVLSIMTELLAEIHASRQETRDILEHLAGKIAGLAADIGELERASEHSGHDLRGHLSAAVASLHKHIAAKAAPQPVSHALLVTIWSRALLFTGLLWALAIGGIAIILR